MTSKPKCCIPVVVKAPPTVPLVSFVGKPGAGKTTFLEKLIPELKGRGYRVGTIKHDRGGFQMDHPGKDTWRHAQAGSDVVVISSPWQVAMIRKVERELMLDEVVASMPQVDIILVEGYKQARKPKIEVSRRALGTDLLCDGPDLVALVADHEDGPSVPRFGLDDVRGVADLIESRFIVTTAVGQSQGG